MEWSGPTIQLDCGTELRFSASYSGCAAVEMEWSGPTFNWIVEQNCGWWQALKLWTSRN